MPAGPGTSQAECWNGAVGQRWARGQAALDALFAPLTEALLDRAALTEGARVLDVGCGSGETALLAARRVGPGGRVLGLDLSAPLLTVARARAAAEPGGSGEVRFVEADAQEHDPGSGAYDAVLSRFGTMFFADSTAAFANLRRALRPGGRLTLLCWQALESNPWVAVPRAALLSLVEAPPPPPPDAPGPFRFAAPGVLPRLLAEAGFGDVACESLVRPVRLGGPAACDREAAVGAARLALDLGPVSHLVREAEPALHAAALAAVTEALLPHARDGTVVLDAACWLVDAG